MMMIALAARAQMPPTERVEGVPLGVRVILQLLVAVTELAGPEAASKLTLLVSCSDRELRDLMGEVLGRRFFGMEPQNLIILPQVRDMVVPKAWPRA